MHPSTSRCPLVDLSGSAAAHGRTAPHEAGGCVGVVSLLTR
ncbi:hypothetical protein [Kineococcus sp. SYSU DK006]